MPIYNQYLQFSVSARLEDTSLSKSAVFDTLRNLAQLVRSVYGCGRLYILRERPGIMSYRNSTDYVMPTYTNFGRLATRHAVRPAAQLEYADRRLRDGRQAKLRVRVYGSTYGYWRIQPDLELPDVKTAFKSTDHIGCK